MTLLSLKDTAPYGILGPRGISITVHNITHPQPKQAIGLILASIRAAVGLAAPWGGSACHEATLTSLTRSIATQDQDTGDTLQNLW